MMNARARRLGLRNTHYVRPDGLDAAGHYSSARDVTFLARVLMHYPVVRQIVRRRTATITGASLHTWNDLLYSYPGIFGVKTGHTSGAGWNETAAVHRRGVSIYATLLGSPDRSTRNADLVKLLDWGFSRYVGYLWPGLGQWDFAVIAAVVGVLNVALLYRAIGPIGKLTVTLWVGTLLTTGAVIATGALHFDPAKAFDFPPGAFQFSLGFLLGLGAASRIGIYDYLGYYDVCYIGEEVRDPGRVIPRSIFWSILAVALIYLAINLSIIGVVPWREFVPASERPGADFVVSLFMEKIYGHRVAALFTAMILWTAFGSVFALLLGYSRIPYAAALDGYFFKVFGRLHPTKGFPHVSLLVIGIVSIVCSFVSLGLVIDALITTRILVQFIGQIGAVALLRKRTPEASRPYKMWLYPLPSLVALAGWIFVFATSEPLVILFGLGTLMLGGVGFLAWSWHVRSWPFAPAGA